MSFNTKDGLYSKNFDLSQLNKNLSQWNYLLVQLLSMAIETSFEHDQYLQGVLEQSILDNHQIWVLTQYYIEIYQLPHENDKVTIQTRVVEANRFLVTRYFSIYVEDVLMVDLYAQFAVIDFKQRDVVRLDVSPLVTSQVIDKAKAFKFPRIGKNQILEVQETFHYEIQASDIDENAHVNNLVYLRWCFDALKQTDAVVTIPKMIQVKYGKEILPEHSVKILLHKEQESDNLGALFTIFNETTQEEACLVKFVGQN